MNHLAMGRKIRLATSSYFCLSNKFLIRLSYVIHPSMRDRGESDTACYQTQDEVY